MIASDLHLIQFLFLLSFYLTVLSVAFIGSRGLLSHLLLLVSFEHHLRGHEFVLEDLLRMNPLARVQAHYLIEQVDEVRVADPLVAVVVKAFLEDSHQVAKAATEQLVLFHHDF